MKILWTNTTKSGKIPKSLKSNFDDVFSRWCAVAPANQPLIGEHALAKLI
ncbi:MAG: hypothetical protein KBD66_02510 [Candidatus Doudnabacteria bacterium]|nr:hypothetical protein [Candidatus Doudnabacteria bacterium]